MDGLTFLKILQEHYPVPVVVVSSLTPSGSAKALEALAAGALDVLAKPDGSGNLGQLAHRLAYHVKAAAHSRRDPPRLKPATEPAVPVAPSIRPGTFSARRVILIGSSTGGVEALRFLLPRLPDGLPPIVVVQHIPPNFSRIMANHLDELCPFTVHEAVDGEELRPGLCLVAPGDFHLALAAAGRGYRVRLDAVATRAPLPPLGGRFVSLRGRARRGSGGRGPTHGDGRRWCARPPVAARSRVTHPRSG